MLGGDQGEQQVDEAGGTDVGQRRAGVDGVAGACALVSLALGGGEWHASLGGDRHPRIVTVTSGTVKRRSQLLPALGQTGAGEGTFRNASAIATATEAGR